MLSRTRPQDVVDHLRELIQGRGRSPHGRVLEQTHRLPQALDLAPGSIHEWFYQPRGDLSEGSDAAADGRSRGGAGHHRECPLGLLMEVARQAQGLDAGRSLCVWVGRHCWPYPPAVHRVSPRLLGGSVFVEVPGHDVRLWAVELALRSAGVAAVIADARRLTLTQSRRLQLAAEAGGALGLLVRPGSEAGELSAARTRWRVTPMAHEPDTARASHGCGTSHVHAGQAWSVQLLRCKGMRPETGGARHWVVRRSHATGHVHLAPDAADRSAGSPATALRLGA